MKNIKLIGLSIFLVGVLSYNISTLSNTSGVNISDLQMEAYAGGEGTKGWGEAERTCPPNQSGIKCTYTDDDSTCSKTHCS